MAVVDLNFTDLFEEAFDSAGAEMRTAYDIRMARRALKLLMDEWANRGLNLWTVEDGTISMVAGTATYTLPADTVDLLEAQTQTTDGNTEYSLRRVGVGTYAKYSKKNQSGRPSVYFVERLTAPTVTLWPVPDKAYTLVYWRMRRLEAISSGLAGTPDMPHRFVPALVAGMAVRIARNKKNYQVLPELKMDYETQFALAYDEDRDRSSYYMTPGGLR